MAVYMQGILGPFSGRVGNVVGCICTKRSSYMRSLPMSYHDAKTDAQLRNRARMRETMAFLSVAKAFVNHTLKGLAVRQTEMNVATGWNFHKVDMEEDGSRAKMRYRELRLSKGLRSGLEGAMLLRGSEGLMLVWEERVTSGMAEGSDSVHVLVYNETRHEARVRLEAVRRIAGEYRLDVPHRWLEERLHVYVAVSDEDGKMFSDSQYFVSGERERREFSMQEKVGKRFCQEQSAIKEVSECCSDRVEDRVEKGRERGEEGLRNEEKGILGEGNRDFGGEKRCLGDGEGPLRE